MPVVNKALVAVFMCWALMLPSIVAGASVQKSPPSLPETVQDAAEGPELQLLGYGRMRWWFWDAFDASLWITGDTWNWNEPFVLELRYVRNFDGSEIVDGTRDQWEHLGYDNDIQHRTWLSQLTGIFPNVKAGDQLAGVYLPGRETHFFHNGRPIGTMLSPEFGRAFFSIWLDEKTSQPSLRHALLGGDCVRPTVVAESEEVSCGGGTMRPPTPRRHGPDRS